MYKRSCDIARHSHEEGLSSQLKGPEANLLESSFACLVIHHVTGECVVGLVNILAQLSQ